MNSKGYSTIRRHSLTRRVIGMFAAVWLNLALQPCSLAADADHDCPHCPPAHEHTMPAHHEHGVTPEPSHCSSLDAPCGELDDASLDGRQGQQKTEDTGDYPVAVPPVIHENTGDVATPAYLPAGPPRRSGRPPPIHILNCVYLN